MPADVYILEAHITPAVLFPKNTIRKLLNV
jgi:hypothetical protein